jgi:hypothetical protein
MAPLVFLVLFTAVEAEPGLIDPDVVSVGQLQIPTRRGNAKSAHETFLAAHRDHKKGDLVAAVTGYIEFLGIPAHAQLPERYARTARSRVEVIRKAVAAAHTRALATYRTDRARGLVDLRTLADAYAMLPEGRAARILVHSDATRAAVRDARSKKPDAVKALEKAILANPDSRYLYEAKSLLVELGGPDLFDPDERIGEGDESDESEPDKDDEESVIEIGD